jgi:hypothetical protein
MSRPLERGQYHSARCDKPRAELRSGSEFCRRAMEHEGRENDRAAPMKVNGRKSCTLSFLGTGEPVCGGK